MWHYTRITIPQQEVKAMKIVIATESTTVLLDCTRRVEINS